MVFRYPEGSEVGQAWDTPPGFVVLRLDGKGFSKFTKPYKKHDEFSPKIEMAMHHATHALLKQIDGAIAAYTVSDEISIVLDLTGQRAVNAWYGGRMQKLLSVPASIAGVEFSFALGNPAYFDAKMFLYSPDGLDFVKDYIWKRRSNGYSNAVSSYASRYLGHREVLRIPTNMRESLLEKAGIRVVESMAVGSLFLKETFESDVEFTHKETGQRIKVRGVERRAWVPQLLRNQDQLDQIHPLP